MAFEVLQRLGDDSVQAALMPEIEKWYTEAKMLLPTLPEEVKIYFFAQDTPGIMKEYGVGGYAYSSEIMSIGFELNFKDKVNQIKQLKSTVYHEALHISQGYTGTQENTTLIECMIYEGLATVFERETLGNHQLYGKYPDDDAVVIKWVKGIKSVPKPWNMEDYAKWAFYDEESRERWMLYKAGTWVIDQILENNSISVLDLTKMSAKEILDLNY